MFRPIMPLSEVPQATARGNHEPTQSRMTNCSPDLTPFMPDQGFVEILWENGQIVMQGQCNRPTKRSFTNTARFQERDSRDAAVIPKPGYFGGDSMVNDFSHSVPSGNGLNSQDDDLVPWLNYPIEDPLQNDYCSEFLPEFSAFNPNPLLSADRISNPERGHGSRAPAGGSEPSRIRASQLFQLPQQCQSPVQPITKFGVAGDQNLQKQDVGTSKPLLNPSSGMGLMNFSHFSRPVALVKSNLQSVDRSRSHEKASAAAFSNPVESTVIQGQSASVPPKVELRSPDKPHQEAVSVEKSEAIHRVDDINTRSSDRVNHEVEKGPEAVVAASSVCSANSAGAESNELKHITKRKNREVEESGYQSEDLEDESVGLKKTTTGRGTSAKRGRAAEVHNLSERRRRDRINEKMRALQELIPHCNKVDKASMLDEAIEYLKTLQLQVQIMAMGSGLCMPPMMLPPGMQHLRQHPMAHFSPMGVNMGMGMGMGMGLGFGMGMLDMNGSPGCPLIPVPPMHGPQFAGQSMPGAPNLHVMPGSTGLQMFGIPRQGFNVPMPHAPPFSAKVSSKTGGTTGPLSVSDPKNPDQRNVNLETNTNTRGSQNQTSTQVAKESFEQSNLVPMGNQALHVCRN